MVESEKTNDALSDAAKAALQEGRLIDAIKIVREDQGLTLLQAKRLLERHVAGARPADAPSVMVKPTVHWTFWLPAFAGLLGPLREAWQVYDAGNMVGHCKRSSAVCTYGSKIGADLFGAEQAYLGYALTLVVLGALMVALSAYLFVRKPAQSKKMVP